MQDAHDPQPLWLQWFLNAENTDQAALRAALWVVPDEFWPSVSEDISRGLADLSAQDEDWAGHALQGHPATGLRRQNPTLEMKHSLLREERERRAAA